MKQPQGSSAAEFEALAQRLAEGRPSRGAARTHAVMASEMLDGVAKFEGELGDISAEEKSSLIATGGLARASADLHRTVQVALAHALTAIALELTSRAPDD